MRELSYIGNDLARILPNSEELIIFRLTPFEEKRNKVEFYTPKNCFISLMAKGYLN